MINILLLFYFLFKFDKNDGAIGIKNVSRDFLNRAIHTIASLKIPKNTCTADFENSQYQNNDSCLLAKRIKSRKYLNDRPDLP